MSLFYYPLKKSESQRFSGVFKGLKYRNETLALNGLMSVYLKGKTASINNKKDQIANQFQIKL